MVRVATNLGLLLLFTSPSSTCLISCRVCVHILPSACAADTESIATATAAFGLLQIEISFHAA